MRILHISNANEKRDGALFYSVQSRINNGLIRNGHCVYFFSDRDIARHSNILGHRKLGIGKCNQRLLNVCRNFQPELVLLMHADIILPDTLLQIRDLLPGVRIAQYNVDGLFFPKNLTVLRSKAGIVDATFVTTAGPGLLATAAGSGFVAYMPYPVDSSIDVNRCHERIDQPNDIFFAFGTSQHTPERDAIPSALRSALPELVLDVRSMGTGNPVFGQDYIRAIGNARMGLSLSHDGNRGRMGTPEQLYLYTSDRLFNYLGNGLLAFTSDRFRLADLFTADELVCYSSTEDLVERVGWFKTHDKERQRIATNGWRKAHAEFNERFVAQYLVEATFGQSFTRDYAWPTTRYYAEPVPAAS